MKGVVVAEVWPLSETEVREVILKFWRLNAENAPISEFAPILDEDFALDRHWTAADRVS